MLNLEPYIPKISGFLLGLGQKCIVAAIKKWKETNDKAKAAKSIAVISEHEAAKRISLKIEQRITASVRRLNLSQEQLEILVAVENNPTLKEELAGLYIRGEISPELLVRRLVAEQSTLASAYDDLLLLASEWMESMDKAVADDTTLSQVLTLIAQRNVRNELIAIGNQLTKAQVRDTQAETLATQRHEELLTRLTEMAAGLRPAIPDSAPSIPDALKTQNQRRFERARAKLMEGSVVDAEHEFRGIIEDLEVLGSYTDRELLLRSYINLASSLWEQNRKSEAADWFEKAATYMPEDWRAKQGRAFALIWRNDVDGALQLFREVRQLKPENFDFLYNEAWLLKNSGRHDDAIRLLEAHEVAESDYFAILALCYLRAERHDDAERAARRAVELDSKCEAAQEALAYALAFPIINRRFRRETLQLVPNADDRKRLLEAIQAAESAAASLQKRQRFQSLGEILGNLCAFYAAVANLPKAAECGEASLKINLTDESTLSNLWCVYIRSENFKGAISVAQTLFEITGDVQNWERRAQALIAADCSQNVIDEWEVLKAKEEFAKSIGGITLVAKALSRCHRTDEALQILDRALSNHPYNAELLSERGLLLERIGRLTDAEANFSAAETNASAYHKGQVLAENAMFWYRRRDWKKAAERLEQLGADNVDNPLFSKYLICSFNLGKYRRSLELAEIAIAAANEFIEDHHAIAARCYQLCDNLPRAKEILNKLIARSTSRELEFRKLLGWIYWRLDELPQAYDVLVKGLVNDPQDLDSLILLSAVCSARGRHREALQNARMAVEVSPESVQSHTALVRAGFACPSDFQITDEDRDAHFRSLTFLQQHESRIVQTVPIEPDFRSLAEMLKKRSEGVRKFEDFFQRQKLPLGLFAKGVGCSAFTLWASLLSHSRIPLRMAWGTAEEQESELRSAESTDSISLDVLAMFTMQHLNLLHLLPKFFRRIYAHSSLLDSVVNELRQLQQHPTAGNLKYSEGRIVHSERTSQERNTIEKCLIEIRDFLKGSAVTLVGLVPESVKDEKCQLLLDKCGQEFVAPLLLAVERKVTLFSDDAVIRGIGNVQYEVPSFCSQALLRAALARGVISATEYQDSVIKLIQSNYKFVSEDAGTLRHEYYRSNGHITPLAKTLIHRVNDKNFNSGSCLPLLAEFSVHVWGEPAPAAMDSREVWVREIWDAVARAKDAPTLLMEFVGKLAVSSLMQPGIFAGIVTFAINNVEALREDRAIIYQTMQESMTSVIRVTRQLYPYWPQLARNWEKQHRLNVLLVRRNLLKLF